MVYREPFVVEEPPPLATRRRAAVLAVLTETSTARWQCGPGFPWVPPSGDRVCLVGTEGMLTEELLFRPKTLSEAWERLVVEGLIPADWSDEPPGLFRCAKGTLHGKPMGWMKRPTTWSDLIAWTSVEEDSIRLACALIPEVQRELVQEGLRFDTASSVVGEGLEWNVVRGAPGSPFDSARPLFYWGERTLVRSGYYGRWAPEGEKTVFGFTTPENEASPAIRRLWRLGWVIDHVSAPFISLRVPEWG